jgi:hypothetical protein
MAKSGLKLLDLVDQIERDDQLDCLDTALIRTI